MRIATGVLLIIVALLNIMIGGCSALVGGVVTAGADIAEEAAENQAEGDVQFTVNQEELDDVAGVGGSLLLFGIFTLILGGMQIAGAVCLFISKASKFIMVVGGLGLLGVLLAFVMASGGGWYVYLSGAISVMALVSGKALGDETSGGGASAPA